MPKLTKYEFVYINDRCTRIIRDGVNVFSTTFPEKKKGKEWMAGQILMRKAKIKEDTFKKDSCPYGNLFNHFDFPGDDERGAFNKYRQQYFEKLRDKLRDKRDSHLDEYILTRETDDKLISSFEKYVKSEIKKAITDFRSKTKKRK